MDVAAIVGLILTLIAKLAPLVAKAITDKDATHDQILADAKAAIDEFHSAVGALPSKLAADDAAMDAKLDGEILK